MKNNSKLITILIAISLVVIVAEIIATFTLNNKDSINWIEEESDIQLTETSQSVLHFAVDAKDKDGEKVKDITFSATSGSLEISNNEVTWYLPQESGIYTIEAKTKTASISHRINYDYVGETLLGGVLTPEIKLTDDSDNDGLINEEEDKLGTNAHNYDTDHDGLGDGYEVKQSKTDPLKADSDNDGLNDGNEIALKMDPLSPSTNNDGIKDGDRILTYTETSKENGIKITVTGKGNIASVVSKVSGAQDASKGSGQVLNSFFDFQVDAKLTSATVTIPYDPEEIAQSGILEDELTLYYIDSKTGKKTSVPTIVDKRNHTITAELDHFSTYTVGGREIAAKETMTGSSILFLIDNSVSLYTTEQMEAQGYPESKGANGTDKYYYRFSSTIKALNKLMAPNPHRYTDNQWAVSEFSGTYANISGFSIDKSSYKSELNSMKNTWKTDPRTGTNLGGALKSAVKEFSDRSADGYKNYIILLTDGEDTAGSFKESNVSTYITELKNSNIHVCVIGISDDVDKQTLEKLATGTGCKYYHATNQASIDKAYDDIVGIIDNLYAGNSLIIGQTNFQISRDAYYITNYTTVDAPGGHCLGLNVAAWLKYKNQLPAKRGSTTRPQKMNGKTVTVSYDIQGTSIQTKSAYNYRFKTPNLLFLLRKGWPYPTSTLMSVHDGQMDEQYYDSKPDSKGRAVFQQSYRDQLTKIGVKTKFEDKREVVDYPIDDKNPDFRKNADPEDVKLLDMFYFWYTLNFDSWLSWHLDSNPQETINYINYMLDNDEPVVLGLCTPKAGGAAGETDGCHSVNLIRVTQELNDLDKFTIYVYDTNRPYAEQPVYITRTKVTAGATGDDLGYSYTVQYDKQKKGLETVYLFVKSYTASEFVTHY